MAKEVGRWKLGLMIVVVMVEEVVPYLEEGDVGGVENKSLMGSMLIGKGEECLDGWFQAGGGEVKGGGIVLGVTKSLLGVPTNERLKAKKQKKLL
uniref:Uncharacterized protein n=1 Tax=Tanacetum cinerariifolium TaxID=118510 RepID=A0A699RXN1_TANCI|nr:hypothetical protein [Tanacetum cinerariifolium]